MNLQFHDEFIALCALFFAGELTDEERALLQVHLAYCDSCRTRFEEYQRLHADVIPLLAASASSEPEGAAKSSGFSLEAAEQRLMAQLDTNASESAMKNEGRHRTIMLVSPGAITGSRPVLTDRLCSPANSSRQLTSTIPQLSYWRFAGLHGEHSF